MCNLYSYKMTADQMRALKLHYQFIGTTWTEWEERHRQRNEPIEDVYERALAGIKRAREVLGYESVSALMTTTRASLGRARDIVDEYVSQGFNNIFLRALSPYGFAIKTKTYAAYDTS